MLQPEHRSLWELTARVGLSTRRFISDASSRIAVADLAGCGTLDASPEALRGRSVVISSTRQLPTVLALLQLDGVAHRVLLCPPDLASAHMPLIMDEADADVVVSDGTGPAAEPPTPVRIISCGTALAPATTPRDRSGTTEWLLLTSGTTARPKIVVHTLASLIAPLEDGLSVSSEAVWGTFYDVRRYGGLQILLRALLGGGSLVLSQSGETARDFLARAGQSGVTHISGTPSHWRRALMSEIPSCFSPKYVRLSGEAVDQVILNNLALAFPKASIAHAFASTEAGVAFDVRDGKAGFPATIVRGANNNIEMRVVDGSLRIRSNRMASRYLGNGRSLVDEDGSVDTGDMVELRGDRYYFVGRREGIINVGGLKVHPEEVEAVINRHPDVQIARVRGRSSPITGAIVVADVIVRKPKSLTSITDEILKTCRRVLPPHKIPVIMREVQSIDIMESGKMIRRRA